MLHHLSVTAREPRKVAEVLAEIMDGEVGRFMPNAGSWYVKTREEGNIHVEIYPLGTELHPNPAAAQDRLAVPEFRIGAKTQYSGRSSISQGERVGRRPRAIADRFDSSMSGSKTACSSKC